MRQAPKSSLSGYLNQLTKDLVFNRYDAERYLLLASDLPGYTVRLTLRPAGSAPGEVVGDVTVQRPPAYVDFNVQNGGSDALGPWGGLLRAERPHRPRRPDPASAPALRTSTSSRPSRSATTSASAKASIGDTFIYAWRGLKSPIPKVLARTLPNTIEVGYPLVRRQAQTLRASAGLDHRQSRRQARRDQGHQGSLARRVLGSASMCH